MKTQPATAPTDASNPGSFHRRVIVAGATGLIGAELCSILAARGDVEVVALVRSAKPGRFPDSVQELVFDYDSDTSYAGLRESSPFALFCCLGTTRGKAGSDEAFQRVDRDYPIRLVDAMKRCARHPIYALVSSVGADSPRGLYLKTKAEVETAVTSSDLSYVIARPSLLLGNRQELRVGERIGAVTFGPIMSGLGAVFTGLKRYSPIAAHDVARALAKVTLDGQAGHHVLEGADLFAAAKGVGSTAP